MLTDTNNTYINSIGICFCFPRKILNSYNAKTLPELELKAFHPKSTSKN